MRRSTPSLVGLLCAITMAACAPRNAAPPRASSPAPPGVDRAYADSAGARAAASASPAARSDVDAFVGAAVARASQVFGSHCVSCHDEHHALDLRTPPDRRNGEAWLGIATVVENGRMPPKTAETPFPLDPAVRNQLFSDAVAIGEAGARPVPAMGMLSAATWMAIVHEIADPVIGAAKVEAIASRNRGGIGGVREWGPVGERIPSMAGFDDVLGHVNQNRISHEVCRAMVEADARAAGPRRFLPTAPSDPPVAASVASELLRRIDGAEPTSADVALASMLFERFYARAENTAAAIGALCTAYLSGPRLWILPLHTTRGR